MTGSAAGDEGENEHGREVHQEVRRGVGGANTEALQHVRETAQRRDRGECTCTLTALFTKPSNAFCRRQKRSLEIVFMFPA